MSGTQRDPRKEVRAATTTTETYMGDVTDTLQQREDGAGDKA